MKVSSDLERCRIEAYDFIYRLSHFDLSPRDIRILVWRYYKELTLREVAELEEISYQAVQQREIRICKQLKPLITKLEEVMMP